MHPLFSFIVPIYNAQRFLFDCLDSIKNQSFGDFEAILIDDGSTDQSSFIAASFSQADPRFHYYKQENRGTSGATNTALSLARGDFIINLDNDDFVDPRLLTKSKEIIDRHAPDIVQFQSTFISEGGAETARQEFIEKELLLEGNENLAECERVMPGAFNRTHSRKVIKRSAVGSIRFFGTSKGADTSFLRRVLFCCEKVVLSPDRFFYVRELPTSESRKPNPPHLYKEWFDRELNDLDWCIKENQSYGRALPFWEFGDFLDMFQMFAAKAWRDRAFDSAYFAQLSKRVWAKRHYLVKSGVVEGARWYLWLRHTNLFAKWLSKKVGEDDYIV